MTPRQIAAALDRSPIAGLTHRYGEEGYLDISAFGVPGHHAAATVYLNHDDLSGVFAVGARLGASQLKTKEFWVRPETLRADLVEILAWSLCAVHPAPAAPETRAALRSPGLYSEVLRKFLDNQRAALTFFGDRYATLIAAIDAALETST